MVILVTDGYDEHSSTSMEEAFRALQRVQATVYVVGIGGVAGISLKGEMLLRKVAAQMGGRAFFPSREEQLPDVHALIATEAYSRVRHHLYADQPGVERRVSHHPARGRRAVMHREGSAGLLRAGAAPHPADPGVQRGG